MPWAALTGDGEQTLRLSFNGRVALLPLPASTSAHSVRADLHNRLSKPSPTAPKFQGASPECRAGIGPAIINYLNERREAVMSQATVRRAPRMRWGLIKEE